MSRAYENLKLKWDNRWTPVTDEVRQLIEQAITESGLPRRRFADNVGIKQRHLRRLLNQRDDGSGYSKAVSLHLMDKILCRSSFSHRLHDLTWYTPQEMADLGYWKPQFGGPNNRYSRLRQPPPVLGDPLTHEDGDAILGEHLDDWQESD